MDDERQNLASVISRQRKTVEALGSVALHFQLTEDEKQSLDHLKASLEQQLARNRRLLIRKTKNAKPTKEKTTSAKKKKPKKQQMARYCTQCKEKVPAGEFLQHFKRVHGRPPTPGEKNQSHKHRSYTGTTFDGDKPPRGPTVQGGSPGLGRRS
ncbi:hypothetical protein [Spongiibacter tropicus]|uniref:hypothetical protein n=1 Tax=Spongiibacter tropicus TaxID=454602 RepID=UPI0024E1CC33|nr:hypothetical protein [Spongiibacter tropicus]